MDSKFVSEFLDPKISWEGTKKPPKRSKVVGISVVNDFVIVIIYVTDYL